VRRVHRRIRADDAAANQRESSPRGNSGAEVTALQTLARLRCGLGFAQRLECDAFTAAFGRTMRPRTNANLRPGGTAVLKSPHAKRWRDCGAASDSRSA